MSRKHDLDRIVKKYYDVWNNSPYPINGEYFWLVVEKGELVRWNSFSPKYIKYPADDISLEEFESLLVMEKL